MYEEGLACSQRIVWRYHGSIPSFGRVQLLSVVHSVNELPTINENLRAYGTKEETYVRIKRVVV